MSGGQVKVVQDFTADRAILESTLSKIAGGEGKTAGGGIAHRLSTIETAAHILASLPGRKSLIYFASGIERPGADDQAALRSAIDAAIKSNVAIYTIDVRGLVGTIYPQFGAQVAPAAPQAAPEAQPMVQGSVGVDWAPPLANYESAGAAPSGKSGAEGPAANRTVVSRGVPDDYKIGAGDVLDINIWKEPDASVRSIVVRPDGKISMPLLKEVDAAGLTPIQLERLITDGLSKVINTPDVTVVVTGINSKKVYVSGKVTKEGPIPYTYRMTIMQALSEAGGITDYAKKKAIYVLRDENGREFRFPFDYGAVLTGERMELNIPLQPGDVIVVP